MDTPDPERPPEAPSPRPPAGALSRLRARPRSGFTLAEVLIAGFVMVLAIASSIVTMQYGFRALDTARKTTLAAQIMQSEMEYLRMLSWTRVTDLLTANAKIEISEIFPQNTATEKKILSEMEKTFTATRTVAYVAGTDDQIIEISINVSWKGIDGVSHQRSSNTRYCNDGLYNYYYTLNKVSS